MKTKRMIAAVCLALFAAALFSCDMGLLPDLTGSRSNNVTNTGGTTPGNTGAAGNYEDIYGKYTYGSDVYEYGNDGYVYKNNDKLYRYSILDGGRLRLYRGIGESSGYDDYDYTYKDGSLVYNGRTYSRLDPTQN